MDSLTLGESDPQTGESSMTAWKTIGFDLDGIETTSSSTNVCVPGSSLAQVDGVDGIDNSWGSSFLPLLQTALSDQPISADVTSSILGGRTTTLLRIVGLTDTRQTATGLMGAASMGASLTLNGDIGASTKWPSVSATSITFNTVYVVDGTIVARDADGPLAMTLWPRERFGLGSQPVPLALSIHGPVLTLRRVPSATFGVLAGTLDTTEVIDSLHLLAARISQTLCGSAFDGITAQVVGMQDIMLDGTNTPGVPCNAISIGVKFTAKQIANDATTVDPAPLPNPCAFDAGTD